MASKDVPGNQNTGEKCELKIWHERYKKDGKQELVVVDTLSQLSLGLTQKDGEYALVARQIFDDKNVWESTKVTINSTHILKAFSEVIGSHPTVPSDFHNPTELESPFQILFHHWDSLDEYRKSVEDDTARMHLNLLFDFMEMEIGISRRAVQDMIRNNQIGFDQMWTLFPPREILYTLHRGHPWLMKAVKAEYEESQTMGKYLSVFCTHTNYDGTDAGDATQIINVRQKSSFPADHPALITALPIFPLKFRKDHKDLEKKMADRGTQFLRLRGIQVKSYNGTALYVKELPPSYYSPDMDDDSDVYLPYTESGRVIIDKKTFIEEHNIERVARSPYSRGDPEEFPAEKRMLCPPFVQGYSLSRKEWCRFFIKNIAEVDWSPDVFKSLVLDPNKKRILRALISSHEFSDNSRDQVQQKGKGLVFLLHGTPGSGKTLTAESVAEVTKRAVLSTTMGELNRWNSSWYFEHKLKNLLQYATTWKAIVLLDEADVFLEARQEDSSGSAERNALVAVFLRHLEYFSGIVFLTTNRIQVIDAAMKSRIHLAMGYEPPQLQMRRLIWTSYLSKIPDDECGFDLSSTVESLVSHTLNGREISNATNTARTLARYEKEPLVLRHLETVLNVRDEFEISLKRTRDRVASQSEAGGSVMRQNSLLAMTEESSPR